MSDAAKKTQGDEILEICDKALLAIAFAEVAAKAAARVQWLLSREGDTFTDEEKAEILAELSASSINLDNVLRRAEAAGR